MLNTNRRRYYREMIETGLNKIGLKGKQAVPIIEKIETKINLLPERLLVPDNFFNFERSARIIANQESRKPGDILANFDRHIPDLFEIHDLFLANDVKPQYLAPHVTNPAFDVKESAIKAKNDRGRPQKPMPDLDTIALAAIAVKKDTNRLPNRNAGGHAHLPEGSTSWSGIINTLVDNGTSIKKVVQEYAAAHNLEIPGIKLTAAKISKIMPSSDNIAKAAIAYLNENGKLPNHNNGKNGIPDNSVGWAIIVRNLRKEETTIAQVVTAYAAAHHIDLPRKPKAERESKAKIMPSHDIIAKAAIDILMETKKLPNVKSGHIGLPANSPAWSGIVSKLHVKETNLAKVVAAYAAAHNIELPYEPKAESKIRESKAKIMPSRDIIAKAAIEILMETKKLPGTKSGKAGLPDKSPAWSGILSKLRKSGTTLSEVVAVYAAENKIELPKKPRSGNETRKGKGKIMPSHDVIAKASIEILLETKKMPNVKSGNTGLPENSPAWSGILSKLRKGGTTLSEVVAVYAAENKIELPQRSRAENKTREGKAKTVPSHDVIAKTAIDILLEAGKLPNVKSGKTGLPETSPLWQSVIKKLRKDNVSLAEIVQSYAAAHDIQLPENAAKSTRTQKYKIMLSREDIAKIAIAQLQENGKMPNHNDSKLGLPENSVGWAAIVRHLRKDKTTLFQVVAAYATAHEIELPQKSKAEPKVRQSKEKIMPPHDVIAKAAIDILLETKKWPNAKSSIAGLPEKSPAWSGIIAKLNKAQTPLKQIVKAYAAQNAIELPVKETKTKPEKTQKILPSELDIAIAATAIKKDTGMLPKAGSGHTKLPENSLAWSSIIHHFRDAGKTIKQIVEENRDKLPAPEMHARDLFNQAVIAIYKNNALPADPVIDRCFRENKVFGLEEVLGKKAPKIDCAQSFYVAAGLAEKDQGCLSLPSRAVISQYSRLIRE